MTSDEAAVSVCADASALAEAAATLFSATAEMAVSARGHFSVALAGGSTPRLLYERLSASYRHSIEWRAVHLFMGDERYVPADHPDSNFRAASDALVSRVPIPESQIHRIPTALTEAADVAAAYERTLRREFDLDDAGVPAFDLVLLGLGTDGHTASLFPGSDALRPTPRLVLAPWVRQHRAYRITLTLPVLNRASRVLFLVSGAEKADVLRDVLTGQAGPEQLPAQLVQPGPGRLQWLVDQAAAARLPGR